MSSNWSVGEELHVRLEFDSKKEVQNVVKQYLMKVHQTLEVVESKSTRYVVHCDKDTNDASCSFYLKAIQSKRTNRWKVTEWDGPYTCLNLSLTQDHENLDSDLISSYIVGM